MNPLKLCVLCARVLVQNEKQQDFKSVELNKIINSLYNIDCEQYDETISSICESCVKSTISISTHINCVLENQKHVRFSSLLMKQLSQKTEENDINIIETSDLLFAQNQAESYSAILKRNSTAINTASIQQPKKSASNANLNKNNNKTPNTENGNNDENSTESASSPKRMKHETTKWNKLNIETFNAGENVKYFDYSTNKIMKATIFEVTGNNYYRIVVGKESWKRHARFLSKIDDKKSNDKKK